jgi:hypothetical protein
MKRGHSTTTNSIELQSMISRALDDDKFVLVASLDLSSAYDVVNIKLLIKCLKIVQLPSDIINLITVWLMGRFIYISILE